ncbi:MAG: 2-hydroxyacyl-CoA dehydratase family protein [Oscillospiraceae bacterium]|nr:2-hydroxyacyl-CoA dehydratase family protein [Oscillospiraceae bacterium]
MKTATVIRNPKEKVGEKQYGVLFDGGKVRRRREWRGVKDTFYDYTRWLYLVSVLTRFIVKPRNIKGFFRYRWMRCYLGVMHGMDKFTMGLRDEPLRITHTAMNYVIADVTQAIDNAFRGDRRVGNNQKYSRDCVLCDENAMTAFLMGFPNVHGILREVPTMFAANIFNQFSTIHYLDIAQQFGIPGDVCPMPEAEAGISIEDDFPVLGCCAVQVNTTCDGSLMCNGVIAKRLECEYGIPTFQLVAPMRHREEDVQKYAAEDMKMAIAFVEEHTGQKWDWAAYFECARRVNDATRKRMAQMEINSSPYPQFFGAVFSLYNDTNYMGNCGRNAEFVRKDKKLLELAERGYRKKTMVAKEYRHRCIVWGVQPQYVIDMLYWMLQCWGVMPLTDMLSMVNTRMIADTDTPENREQAYYDMAWLNENMIMRNRTHGGYKVLVDELWEFCEEMNADMVMMWEHMSCKALDGMHGQFEEQARERGIHLVWVSHDLCDPRVFTRQAIRDQFNNYMRTVMREEPLDPTIEILPDENAW